MAAAKKTGSARVRCGSKLAVAIGVLCAVGRVAAQSDSLPAIRERPAVEPLVPGDAPVDYDDFVGTYMEDAAHVKMAGKLWFIRFELLPGPAARWTASDDGRETYQIDGAVTLSGARLHIDWESGERRGRLAKVPEDETFIAMRWGQRHYLLLESEAEEFCRAVEAGHEPSYRDSIAHLRSGEWKLPVSGLPDLPMPWRAWLRSRSIEGQVSRIEDGGAWIDRGESSGLRPGDRLALFDPSVLIPQRELIALEVVDLLPDTARVRCPANWARHLKVGQWVSTLRTLNHQRLAVPTRSVKVRDRSLNKLPENRLVLSVKPLAPRPGTEGRCNEWAETLRAYVGRDDSLEAPGSLSPRPELRGALDGIAIADLTPALITEAIRLPLSRPETVRQAAVLVSYWNQRQRGVHPVAFDADAQRITPLALHERLQALYDWAEWWRATAADPQALASWTAAVSRAGGY